MTLDLSTVLAGLVPAVVGFLLNRGIRGLDKTIELLSKKVDALTSQGTTIEVRLALLEARVFHDHK